MRAHHELHEALDDPDRGFDVVVVSAASAARAAAWRARLEATRGAVIRGDAALVVVHEDWPGGAGNALGTLFALREAARAVPDLWARIEGGASVGIWHTAGRGQRLYPLPAVDGGDKAAVRLPGAVGVGGVEAPITLLEAAIRGARALDRVGGGRISVFWGDQLVAPARPLRPPTHPVALLGRVGPIPDAAAWERHGLRHYGLVALGADGAGAQLEKLERGAFSAVVGGGALGPVGAVATSLGSFSMTPALARALLGAFAPELEARAGRLDTDPGWWMPLSLPSAAWAALGGDPAHRERLRAVAAAAELPPRPLSVVDLGADAPWWDFGRLDTWFASCRAVLDPGEPAAALRAILGTPAPEGGVVRVGCEAAGEAVGSVLVDVHTPDLRAVGAVAIGARAPRVRLDRAAAYACEDPVAIDVPAARLRADAPGVGPLRARLDGDAKADWERRVEGNALSWAELAARG